SSQFEPIHFFKDTGWLDISLRVGYNGCYDTLIKQDYVYVKGPIAEFSYVIDCDNPFVVPFQSIMKDVTRYYWDFGDLSPLDSQQINPIHQFTNTTNYTVTLYTFNDSSGCSSEFDLFVKIRNLKANFSISDSIACFPTTLQLNANPSQDELPGNYYWDVGGGFIFMANASFNHQYTQPGKHFITLVVSDENYCTDTVTKWVKLFKPNAFFEVDTNKGCVPFKPQFFDKSQSDTT